MRLPAKIESYAPPRARGAEATDDAVPETPSGRVAIALAQGLEHAPAGAWHGLKALGGAVVDHPVATGATMVGTVALAAAVPLAGTLAAAAGIGFAAYSIGCKLVKAGRAAAHATTPEAMRRASALAGDAYGETLVNVGLVAGPMAVGHMVASKASEFVAQIQAQAKRVPLKVDPQPGQALIKALSPLAEVPPRELLGDLMSLSNTLAPEKREALLALVQRADFLAADPPHKLLLTVETLGPAFTKLTQVASTSDEIPADLAKVLQATQDGLAPMSRGSLDAILGQEPQDAADVAQGIYRIGGERYRMGDTLGVASVGEVHLVHDLATQQARVLKLRKPAANPESVQQEFQLMEGLVRSWAKVGKVTDNDLQRTLQNLSSFRQGVLDELDMTQEFKNAQRFSAMYGDQPFKGVTVRYASPKGNLLLMDRAQGVPFTKLSTLSADDRDAALLAYMRGLYQQMGSGYFHADPHPGNVFWDAQARRVQFIDMGAMAEISPAQQVQLFEMIGIMLSRNADQLSRYMIQHADRITASLPADQLQAELGQALNRFFETGTEAMDPNKDALAIAKICQDHGVFPHDQGFWFTKTMITIGNVTRGPVGDRWLPELLPPMTRAVAAAARNTPGDVKTMVLNLARAVGQSPGGFAKSIVLLTKAQPDQFRNLPVAFVKVLNELAFPLRVGASGSEAPEAKTVRAR